LKNQIIVEIKKITNPDGTSKLGAITYLEEVLSTPDIKKRLSTMEKEYESFIKQCKEILTRIQTPQGRSDAKLRWKLADKIYSFLNSDTKNIGVVLVNYIDTLCRDLGVSKSDLRYTIKFRHKYRTLEELDSRINWSKYRELLDFPNDKLRKDCETLIKDGKITTDALIREFKQKNRK